jgi:hypothetical protein
MDRQVRESSAGISGADGEERSLVKTGSAEETRNPGRAARRPFVNILNRRACGFTARYKYAVTDRPGPETCLTLGKHSIAFFSQLSRFHSPSP